MNVVITDSIKLSDKGQKMLEQIPNITIHNDTINDPKIIIKRLINADIITANYINITKEIIDNLPKLKYIISPAKGFDWIDVKAATSHRIKVINCPTFNSQAVAEHAIGLMFAVKRKIVEANQSILSGNYNSQLFTGSEVSGNQLVTIGHGEIGKKIIKMAHGLGMKTAFTNSKTPSKRLDKLISTTDVLVLCLPLNNNTRGLINKKRISLLKPNSIIINVARGSVIDQKALFQALTNNKIAGAGIDTFENDETITKTRTDILHFAKLSNVVTTPHIAYNTKESSERLGIELISNINSCINDQAINSIN